MTTQQTLARQEVDEPACVTTDLAAHLLSVQQVDSAGNKGGRRRELTFRVPFYSVYRLTLSCALQLARAMVGKFCTATHFRCFYAGPIVRKTLSI